MRHWSCALCSFQVDAHTQSTRTKKDASRHERHDIYTTVFFLFFLRLTTFLKMTENKKLPDMMWLLIIDFMTGGQVCPLSLGVIDKRRQFLVTDFRVNRRLTLRYQY